MRLLWRSFTILFVFSWFGVFSVTTALADILFIVNTCADGAAARDVLPGDGVCKDTLGRCSFRAAIDDLYYTGITVPVKIIFDPALTCEIFPSDPINPPFQDIAANDVTIDGSVGGDGACLGPEDPCRITIDGRGEVEFATGLHGNNGRISGICFRNFTHWSVAVTNTNNEIRCNRFLGGSKGVFVDGEEADVAWEPAQRTRIVDNEFRFDQAGISIRNGATDTLIEGNFMIVDPTPYANYFFGASLIQDLGTRTRIISNELTGGGMILEGSGVARGNRITGAGFGAVVQGVYEVIKNIISNSFGGGKGSGVLLLHGHNSLIANNTLAGNELAGVFAYIGASETVVENNEIVDSPIGVLGSSFLSHGPAATGIKIVGNTYKRVGMAIDLAADETFGDGETPIDAGDLDDGVNGMQNPPFLTSVVTGGGHTFIQGTLDSMPNGSYLIEVAMVYDGAIISLATRTVQTDSAGHADFGVLIEQELASGVEVVATASVDGSDEGFSTSEFGPGVPTVSGKIMRVRNVYRKGAQGTVVVNGYPCNGECLIPIQVGALVTAKAVAHQGSTFKRWGGVKQCRQRMGTGNECQFLMRGKAGLLTAVFSGK